MKAVFSWLLLALNGWAVEPQPPAVRELDSGKIEPVILHTEMDSLLIFPEPVDLILGKGLTDGSSPGSVQYQHGENAKLVVLRCLGPGKDVLMQILMGDRAFVFRLQAGEKPASVIYFRGGEGLAPAKSLPIAAPPVVHQQISSVRQEELIRLTVEAPFLKSKLPEEYAGFDSRAVSGGYSRNRIATKISTIARFSAEDALILVGALRNDSESDIKLGSVVGELRVGGKRLYPLSKLTVSKLGLKAGQEAEFRCVLVGDGRGGAAHLSLENEFELRIRSGGKEGKK